MKIVKTFKLKQFQVFPGLFLPKLSNSRLFQVSRFFGHPVSNTPISVPSTWVHRMVVVVKADGRCRRVVDRSPLNTFCIRETHHVKSLSFKYVKFQQTLGRA